MDTIAKASQGFVYFVSLTGITRARTSVQSRVQGLLKKLKEVTLFPFRSQTVCRLRCVRLRAHRFVPSCVRLVLVFSRPRSLC
ncbi:hypothetical protein M758_UG302200 [Ceratodon purpureus]|nr:hypothetical protein M758_UG302200 [Ceratodon purpureus]